MSLQKTGLCHGVFDIIHAGHIEHFKAAKEMVDYLIVSITSVEFVNKGPGRPSQDNLRRKQVLEAISYIDEVIINHAETSLPIIKKFCPDIYFKGKEYKNESDDITGNIKVERAAVENYGGKIIYTDGFSDSSSRLIKSADLDNLSSEQKAVVSEIINSGTTFDNLNENFFSRLKALRILVVGEPIIDQFVTCTPLNISSKNPIVSAELTSEENQFGGVLAVSAAAASLGCQVTQILYNIEAKYKVKIDDYFTGLNVTTIFSDTEECQIPIKRRYISNYKDVKMFEVSEIKSTETYNKDLTALSLDIVRHSQDMDMSIGLNFGHGMWANPSFNVAEVNFTAINVQSNSENFGFNLSKNSRAYSDLLIIDEKELRLNQSDRFRPIKELLQNVSAHESTFKDVILTTGKKGSISRINGNLLECPAFAEIAVDPIGSGDAFFTVYSLCHHLGINSITSSVVANIYAAAHTQFLANSKTVDVRSFKKTLEYVLKC